MGASFGASYSASPGLGGPGGAKRDSSAASILGGLGNGPGRGASFIGLGGGA